MKKNVLVFLACMVATLAASAAEDDAQEALFAQVPTYFRQPDPQRALDLFVQLLETPLFKADGSGQFSSGKFNLFLWAAQVLNHNPQETMHWCETLKSRLAPQDDLATLMTFAATSDSGKCLQQLDISAKTRASLPEIPSVKAFTDENIAIMGATHLDALWASFYASGDAAYVEKIAAFIVAHADGNDPLTLGAARWSLDSNMRQYPEIAAIIGKYKETLPADKRAVLQKQLDSLNTAQ